MKPLSTLEASTLLSESRETVVIRGAGTKQDWGLPPRQTGVVLDTTGLTGIVEHRAGDLVVVVRAGTPMAQLQAALAESGQQLALDTPYPNATVGGTVAANTSGPRRMRYGSVRDLLIGVTIVRADGVIARAGGKVVKNVAGYDLCKLFTGSYGTLGLITECAFRLHPIPSGSTYFPGRHPHASAIEMNGPTEVVSLVESGSGVEAAPSWWGKYPWESGGIGLKLTAALSKVPALIAACEGIAHVRGSLGVGVFYASVTDVAKVEPLRAGAHAAGGHAVVLTAPPSVRDQIDMWGPVPGLELMRRVKQQFDPTGRLAPGRFVGGI